MLMRIIALLTASREVDHVFSDLSTLGDRSLTCTIVITTSSSLFSLRSSLPLLATPSPIAILEQIHLLSLPNPHRPRSLHSFSRPGDTYPRNTTNSPSPLPHPRSHARCYIQEMCTLAHAKLPEFYHSLTLKPGNAQAYRVADRIEFILSDNTPFANTCRLFS
ncbi:hypothetical protein K443DRAFT_510576 [Laccaria amethystina LaAM-08-1]|uniref:Uncharacterized protein n=1 Tax=Laccaria amethystina LaAM-08-1 TaxID=1095629 RepID=A0A0C9WSK9_9AGAR|nr:hypothetical protein K443DRAFT_510576 [Laccaria amethystina LaAM-08-1]